jgi:hypothetical protein
LRDGSVPDLAPIRISAAARCCRASFSAMMSAVLIAVSGLREIESMPHSTSHSAMSG